MSVLLIKNDNDDDGWHTLMPVNNSAAITNDTLYNRLILDTIDVIFWLSKSKSQVRYNISVIRLRRLL